MVSEDRLAYNATGKGSPRSGRLGLTKIGRLLDLNKNAE